VRHWLTASGPSVAITAALLALSLLIQVRFVPSGLTQSQDVWRQKVDLHLTWEPFAIRPFQSQATLCLNRLTSWPLRESFFAIQFALALLLGTLFFRYLRKLGFEPSAAYAGLILLMTAYPILGAHFEPTHTWDDFWSYLFVVLFLTEVLQRKFIWAAIWLTLACYAREQSAFFYPVLVISAVWARQSCPRWRLLTASLLPLVAYIPFRVLVSSRWDFDRWAYWRYNFANPGRTTDTVVSLILAFGIVWLLAAMGCFVLYRDRLWPNRGFVLFGAATTVPITVMVTLTASFARETRIFFPPFVFMIPLALLGFRWLVQRLTEVIAVRLTPVVVASMAVLIPLGFWVVKQYLAAVDYRSNSAFRRQLTGLHIGLSLAVLVLGIVIVIAGQRHRATAKKGLTVDSLTR
jgi:hypothetical protein